MNMEQLDPDVERKWLHDVFDVETDRKEVDRFLLVCVSTFLVII